LYRKTQQAQDAATLDKKRRLKAALEAGKPVPSDLRGEAVQLQKLIQLDDAQAEEAQQTDDRDDEYRWAGTRDPKIVVSTSHEPTSRLKQFAKEVRSIFPNAQRLNRGNMMIVELVSVCRANDVTDIVIVHEHRGEPDGLIISHLPYGPTAYFTLTNVVMRHDIPDAKSSPEAYPHLIFHGFSTPLGQRITNVLKFLFPVPKPDSKRVITFANDSDYISFRHHVYTQKGKEVELAELGPRFELKPFKVVLGTVDQRHIDVEWVARPYMNTAKKRKFL